MKRDFAESPAAAPMEIPASPLNADWQARLALGFADDGGTSRLIERSHFGPLRVQKPLYPEGGRVCHAIIVHPPGGVVGGDQLAIAAHVGAAAHAFITTPGAAKWYKANGKISRQQVQLEVAAGAALEWMPQETIFFDAAQVQLEHRVTLAKEARYIGSEILCFGRTASGESFDSGKITQRTQIRRDGKLIWHEQGALAGSSQAMSSPLGLAGKSVCATVIACGDMLTAPALQVLRDECRALPQECEASALCGVSQLKTVIVARYLGNSSEVAKLWMSLVWRHLRPQIIGKAAEIPRIWNT